MEGLCPSWGRFGCVIHDASASVTEGTSSTPAPGGGNWRMHLLACLVGLTHWWEGVREAVICEALKQGNITRESSSHVNIPGHRF